MKKRSEKQADLDTLKTELAKVSTLILTTFQGITVDNDTKLRRAVQAAGGKYKVVKNTLAERAGAGTPAEGVLKDLKGTNSIAFTYNDPVALAKALTKIAKDVPAFQFKAGVVEGRVISIAEIQSLANLPSKEELISKVMYLLNAPAQRLAMTLNALPRNIAVTVSEAIKINKFGSAGITEKSAAPSAPAAAAPEAAPAAPAAEVATEAKPEAAPEVTPEAAQ
jgi:large subunit ribosomal protein L10